MIDWTHVALAAASGIVTTTATVAVLRNDVKWLRKTLDDHVKSDAEDFKRIEDKLEKAHG